MHVKVQEEKLMMQTTSRPCTHLATAHRQRCECVLEALLKAQELDHAQGHSGVEAQASLVWADGTGELQA
jgi:hypothetical protein